MFRMAYISLLSYHLQLFLLHLRIGKDLGSFQNNLYYFSNEYCWKKLIVLGYKLICYIVNVGDTSWTVMRWVIGVFHTLFYTINHLSIIFFYGVFNSSNA